MQLFFLGTAAAEGYPGIFCDCDNCREARRLGGKSLRMRSALLVNDDLLIDFGPDVLASSLRYNLDLSGVTTVLITHGHEDHFHLAHFHLRRLDCTAQMAIPTMHVFAPQDVTAMLTASAPDLAELRLEAHPVKAFDCWKAGRYEFTAYKAHHALGHYEALFYSVDDGQHAFLYATDTGPFPGETWAALAGKSFDVIILEETMGYGKYTQHLDFQHFVEHVEHMRDQGMLRPGGRVIAHHMSHSWNPTHEKVEAVLTPHGVEVAYDGMVVKL